MSHATSDELTNAHNEGQQFVKEEEGLGFVASFFHQLDDHPTTRRWEAPGSEKSLELDAAYRQGKKNAENQR